MVAKRSRQRCRARRAQLIQLVQVKVTANAGQLDDGSVEGVELDDGRVEGVLKVR
jgi:hypothetical protein